MEQARDTELILDETSRPFVGRWNRLVSTTNWDKGRIIHEWRVALMSSEAASTEYSDDAWSRLVGGVSGQHAGRLRRVYDRFGDVYEQYEGLYWSHFQAALDWDDAEMWLEGALQSGWSVNETRRRRWETLGAIKEDEPRRRVGECRVRRGFLCQQRTLRIRFDASSGPGGERVHGRGS